MATLAALGSGVAFAQGDTTVTTVTSYPTESRHEVSGLTVRAGGGVEGYTGIYNTLTNVGGAWGVTADWKPIGLMGFELAYTGAANNVDSRITGSSDGLTNGADIIRNGGHAAITLGLPTAIEPYALAGVGVDYYSIRGASGTRFQNDTSGSVPLGLGIRTNHRGVSADLRVSYDYLFSDNFAGNVGSGWGDARYNAQFQLGGKF